MKAVTLNTYDNRRFFLAKRIVVDQLCIILYICDILKYFSRFSFQKSPPLGPLASTNFKINFREKERLLKVFKACFKRRILHASNSIHIRFDRNSLSSTFVSNVEFSMHQIQFTLRVGYNHSAACRTKTLWFRL